MARLISLQDVIFAEGFVPYDASNPAGYITLADLDTHLPLLAAPRASPNFTGPASFAGNAQFLGTVDMPSGPITLSSVTPNLILGQPGQPSTPLLSFLSSGYVGRGYDVQFQVTGGSAASDGKGVINLVCNGFTINGASIAWGTASPATVLPLMDGPVALLGTSLNYARQDHVHQSDSTRVATNAASTITDAAASGTTLTISATGNTANGAALRLLGNGATTPSKTVRVLSGAFQIRNDANSANLLNITDAGAATFAGAVSGVTTLAIGGALSGVTTLAMAGALSGATTIGASGQVTAGSLALSGGITGVTTLAMSGQLAGSTISLTGAIQAATTIAHSGAITTNANAAAVPAAPTGTVPLHTLNSADGSIGALVLNSYANNNLLYGRRAAGTGAAPAALTINSPIIGIAAGGHDGTGWSASQGGLSVSASAAWSGASHPIDIRFSTTPVASTSVFERMRLYPSGNVSIQPNTVTYADDGTSPLQINLSTASGWPAALSGVNPLLTGRGGDGSLPAVVLLGYGVNATSSVGGAAYCGRRANGTNGAPTALAANDQVLAFSASGYDGTNWSPEQGGLALMAGGAWSGTSRPIYQSFRTTDVAAIAGLERMRITPPGRVIIQPAGGTFTDDGANALQVSGTTKIDGTGSASPALTVKSTSVGPGAVLQLQGDGATTPNKIIRAHGGQLEIVNSANTAVIAYMGDTGNLTTADLTLNTDASQSALSGAWTIAAAAVSAASGTWSGTGSVHYKKIGRTVFIDILITAITNTSGSGQINVTLPFATVGGPLTMLYGRDNGTGKMVQGFCGGVSTAMGITNYDNTFPSGNGGIYLSGVYETNA